MGGAITPHMSQEGALHAAPSDLCSLEPSRLPRHDIGALTSHRADLHLLRGVLLLASHCGAGSREQCAPGVHLLSDAPVALLAGAQAHKDGVHITAQAPATSRSYASLLLAAKHMHSKQTQVQISTQENRCIALCRHLQGSLSALIICLKLCHVPKCPQCIFRCHIATCKP